MVLGRTRDDLPRAAGLQAALRETLEGQAPQGGQTAVRLTELFVGMAAGAYSSIFIATPLVADLKEAEPQMKALKKRVLAKRAQAAAEEEMAEARGTDADGRDDVAPAVVGPRNQSASRNNRGRGRPSGKRR